MPVTARPMMNNGQNQRALRFEPFRVGMTPAKSANTKNSRKNRRKAKYFIFCARAMNPWKGVSAFVAILIVDSISSYVMPF